MSFAHYGGSRYSLTCPDSPRKTPQESGEAPMWSDWTDTTTLGRVCTSHHLALSSFRLIGEGLQSACQPVCQQSTVWNNFIVRQWHGQVSHHFGQGSKASPSQPSQQIIRWSEYCSYNWLQSPILPVSSTTIESADTQSPVHFPKKYHAYWELFTKANTTRLD